MISREQNSAFRLDRHSQFVASTNPRFGQSGNGDSDLVFTRDPRYTLHSLYFCSH